MSKKEKKEKKAKSKKASQPKARKPVETTALAEAPLLGEEDEVVGTLLSAAEEKDAPASKKSIRKKESKPEQEASSRSEASETETAESGAPAAFGIEPETKPEPLRLPRGAFVGLRKSGGLYFTTSEVVVYPDGRVAYDARGVPQKEYTRLRRVLNDGQTLSLRKLLDQTNFWQAESVGTQNPDGYAYEVAARLGQRSNEVEVFDSSLPEALEPLIERLSKLLPHE